MEAPEPVPRQLQYEFTADTTEMEEIREEAMDPFPIRTTIAPAAIAVRNNTRKKVTPFLRRITNSNQRAVVIGKSGLGKAYLPHNNNLKECKTTEMALLKSQTQLYEVNNFYLGNDNVQYSHVRLNE